MSPRQPPKPRLGDSRETRTSSYPPPLIMKLFAPLIIILSPLSPLSPPGVTSSLTCPAGLGLFQDLTTFPCVCIASDSYTGRVGCNDHTNGNYFCHTTLDCESANEAPALPETTWRPCDPAVDNNPVYECGPCNEGWYSDSVSDACTPCPADSFNPSAGSTSKNDCLACPAELPAAGEGSKSLDECELRKTCFMANLADSYGDGWDSSSGQNTLAVTNDLTDQVMFNIGAQFTDGGSRNDGPFCLAGCGCWTAQVGGGGDIGEVSWNLEIDSEIVAEAVEDEQVRLSTSVHGTGAVLSAPPIVTAPSLVHDTPTSSRLQASFCLACSTSCGVGQQPNANDDGCEPCPTNWYKDAEGGVFCSACK